MLCIVMPVRKQNLKNYQQPSASNPRGNLPGPGKWAASRQLGPWDTPPGLQNTPEWRRNCCKNGSPFFFIFVKNVTGRRGYGLARLSNSTVIKRKIHLCRGSQQCRQNPEPEALWKAAALLFPFKKNESVVPGGKCWLLSFCLFVQCLLLFVIFLFLLSKVYQ